MEVGKIVSLPSLPAGKPTNVSEETPKRRKTHQDGLIGLVNVGNSCYMNASLQALSNCPPFRQYLIDCVNTTSSSNVSGRHASASLATVFRKLWASERNPGYINPRSVSSSMKNKLFRSPQQQDAQEFLRSLLNQIHDELSITIPSYFLQTQQRVTSCPAPRALCTTSQYSVESQESRSSGSSSGSLTKLVDKQKILNSELRTGSGNLATTSSPTSHPKRSFSFPVSPALRPKVVSSAKGLYTHLSVSLSRDKPPVQPMEIPLGQFSSDVEVAIDMEEIKDKDEEDEAEPVFQWSEEDVYVVDNITHSVQVHTVKLPLETSDVQRTGSREEDKLTLSYEGVEGHRNQRTLMAVSPQEEIKPCAATKIKDTVKCSIITEVFEGEFESRVKCSSCKKVSVTREVFQDLSLPIPGRKEMSKMRKGVEEEAPGSEAASKDPQQLQRNFSSKVCGVMKMLMGLTRELITGPATTLNDCLEAFFDTNELTGDNKYYCKHCKSFQDSTKNTSVTKLPEVLCIHLKRFRFDVYFASKISRYISFPLNNLDMTPYMKKTKHLPNTQYELMSVITHFGGAGGGHYVAYAKNSQLNTWHEFNDTHVTPVSSDTVQTTEGYVLFYRRVSPAPVKPLIVSEIVPGPGTAPDSPDACYISQHWLSLRNVMANPGPISQYEFACRHGAVLPGKEDVANSTVSIRIEVWHDLVKRYGGGPLVQSLETCEECASHLLSLAKRRKDEKKLIHQMQVDHRASPKPFYLSHQWLQRWQNFLHCETLEVELPGPIDNTTLLHRDCNGQVSFNSKSQYHLILPMVWNYFHEHYGGGPTVVTRLDTAGLSAGMEER